jgi:hypothetical protein
MVAFLWIPEKIPGARNLGPATKNRLTDPQICDIKAFIRE